MALVHEELRYPAANGKDTICAQIWRDDAEKPRFVLQIVHGMCEYIGRYNGFAEYMVQHGAAVCGNDHTGHGKSKGKDGYGYFAKKSGDRCLVADVRTMNEIIRKRFPGVPVVMLGHSMGSFICRSYITKYGEELAGIVLSGTAGGNPLSGLGMLLAKTIILFRGEKYRSPFLTKLSFGSYNKRYPEKRTQFDWVSRDCAIVDKYVADEACNYMFTASAYLDLFRLLRSVSGKAWAAKVPTDRPYFVLSGSMDPVGNFGKGVKEVCDLLNAAGVHDLSIKIYEGGRHEMLNETNHLEVYDDLLKWFSRILSEPAK